MQFTVQAGSDVTEEYILRVLDPADNMDYERIEVERFITNIKKYYKTIIGTGESPEEFFDVAREKNIKLDGLDYIEENDKAKNIYQRQLRDNLA